MIEGFKWFKVGLAARLCVSLALYSIGVIVQVTNPSMGNYWLGILFVVLGWLPLAMPDATNKPQDMGYEDWRAVGMEEIDHISDNLGRSAAAAKQAGAAPQNALAALAVMVSAVVVFMAFLEEKRETYYLFGDFLFMVMPVLMFGNVTVWIPRDLEMKMKAFVPVFAARLPAGAVLVPYLRFDRDRRGGEVPEDVRVTVDLKRPASDFVGLQFHVAINEGPNGKVPYMYAVVITKGRKGPAWRAATRANLGNFLVEPGGDDDYGSVVIRQATEDGGYYTNESECHRLRDACLGLLGSLSA